MLLFGGYLNAWRSTTHRCIDMVLELAEIVDEHANQLGGLTVIGGLVGPRRARIEDSAVDAVHSYRNLEAEIRVGAEAGHVQQAVEGGGQKRCRIAAAAFTSSAAVK